MLVRIDPRDGRIEPVGSLPKGGRLAFAGGKVYLGGTDGRAADQESRRSTAGAVTP